MISSLLKAFIFYQGVFAIENFHFVTSSCIDFQDIKMFRDISWLLKSKKHLGGTFNTISCSWYVFGNEPLRIGWIDHQLSLSANQSDCELHRIYDTCKIIGEQSLDSIKLAGLAFPVSNIIYMNSNTVISKNPLDYLFSVYRINLQSNILAYYDNKEIIELPVSKNCEISFLILPRREFVDYVDNLTSSKHICELINQIVFHRLKSTPFFEVDIFLVPNQLRYRMIEDKYDSKLNDLTVLVASAGAGIDLNYYPYTIDPKETTNLVIGEYELDCDIRYRIPLTNENSMPSYGLSEAMSTIVDFFGKSNICAMIYGSVIYAGDKGNYSDGLPIVDWVLHASRIALPHPYFWDGIVKPISDNILTSARSSKMIFECKQSDESSSNCISDYIYSDCSIVLFALGDRYLMNAYRQAVLFKSFQSIDLSELCKTAHLNIILYSNVSSIPETVTESLEISLKQYTQVFTSILKLPGDDYIRFIPTHDSVISSLSNVGGQSTQYDISIYWLRISILLHPPSRYVLIVDSEVFPCLKGFERFYFLNSYFMNEIFFLII